MSSLLVNEKRSCPFVGTGTLSIDVDAKVIIQFTTLDQADLFSSHKVQQVDKDLMHGVLLRIMLLDLLSSQADATVWRGR